MSKKIAVLSLALLGTLSNMHAKVVSVNSQQLLMETKRGQQLQKDLMADNQSLQQLQQELQASLAEQSQSVQQRLDMLTPEARNKEVAALEMAKRRAERTLRERQEDMQFNAQQRQAAAQAELMLVAKNESHEQGADALLDASNPSVLAINPDLDITSQVVAKADAQFAEALEGMQADHVDEQVTA